MSGEPFRRSLTRRVVTALFNHYEQRDPSLPQFSQPGAPPAPVDREASKHLSVNRTDERNLIPPEDKLLVFRALTGIDSVPALNTLHHFSRTAQNVGIYTRVVRAEQSAAQRYRFFSILINTCLGIQIVVAAALTALGAASGPHSAVTAFGAINTIMAGVLTYLKGSGLPDRLKYYQNEWRNIREYIEQRERELCLHGCDLDVQEEIQFVERMYEGVKREIESTKSGGGDRLTQSDGRYRRSFMAASGSTRGHPRDLRDTRDPSPVTIPERSYEKH